MPSALRTARWGGSFCLLLCAHAWVNSNTVSRRWQPSTTDTHTPCLTRLPRPEMSHITVAHDGGGPIPPSSLGAENCVVVLCRSFFVWSAPPYSGLLSSDRTLILSRVEHTHTRMCAYKILFERGPSHAVSFLRNSNEKSKSSSV